MANAKPKAITSAKMPAARIPTAAKASRKDNTKTAPDNTNAVAYPIPKGAAKTPMATKAAASSNSFAGLMGMTRGGGKAPKKSK